MSNSLLNLAKIVGLFNWTSLALLLAYVLMIGKPSVISVVTIFLLQALGTGIYFWRLYNEKRSIS